MSLADEDAQRIVTSLEAAMQKMPASIAMHRVALVQTMAAEFTPQEADRLRDLLPSVFAGAHQHLSELALPPVITPAATSKKAWWKFWA